MKKLLAFLSILILFTSAPIRAALPQYVIHDLGTFGGIDADAVDVNQAGHVVGYAYYTGGYYQAFLWDGTPHGIGSGRAYAINDLDQVVGTDSGSGFLWNGTRQVLSIRQARDINNAGDIVGVGSAYQPVLLRGGVVYDLTPGQAGAAMAINEKGQIAGETATIPNYPSNHAFLWQNGTAQELSTLGGRESGATGINNQGIIVGWSELPPPPDGPSPYGGIAGFWWGGYLHQMEGYMMPGDLNSKGWVVGSILEKAAIMTLDGSEITILPSLGGRSSGACAINENGVIVGSAVAPDGYRHAVIWEPVPEPGTALVLLSGLTGYATLRLRARRTRG